MTERRATSIVRWLGAMALLAVGIDHIEQYYVDHYSAVPTIGTLFVLNFASALIVGLALLAPLRRMAGRFERSLTLALAASGIAIAGATLGGLLISENSGLFGFMEVGYRSAIVLSIAFDGAAVLLLAAFLIASTRTIHRKEITT
jgi:hypothetical protein